MNPTTSPPVDQPIRETLTSVFDRNFLVEASAGSGKTTVLVERLVQMLASGAAKVNELAALTFTRKAAGEMRSRFLIRLETVRRQAEDTRVKKRLTQALEGMHQAYIGTIHGFCARVLREYATEAGLPLHFSEVQADEETELIDQLWNQWLRQLSERNDPIINQLEQVGLPLEDLRDGFIRFQQYNDVPEWPAAKVPLPETTGLREKLAEYHQHMLELAPKLPAEVPDRLMQKYRRLPRLAPLVRWHERQNVLAHLEEYDVINSGVVKKRWPGGAKVCDAEWQRWNEFCEKHTLPLLEQWRSFRYPLVMQFLERSERFAREERRRRGRLTFQDLLLTTVELLRSNAQVRRQLGQQWKRLLVDEFQDTDPLQAELLFLLTAQKSTKHWIDAAPRHGSLLLVGDPKQSIYRFRRADIQVYQLVKKQLEAGGGEIVSLTVNFRSQPALVDWINTTFEKQFAEGQGVTQADYSSMAPGREASRTPAECLRYLEFPEEVVGRLKEDVAQNEAEAIARYILDAQEGQLRFDRNEAELKRGLPETAVPGDFMILTKERDRLQHYGDTLSRWGIPNQVTGGGQLNAFPGLRLLYLLLKTAFNPANQVALAGLLRSELCGMSDAQLFAYHQARGPFHCTKQADESVPHAGIVNNVFRQLQEFAGDLQQYPVVAALERCSLTLGLPLWAKVWGEETGLDCLAKAFCCLGDAASRTRSIEGVLFQLERLLKREPRRDGLYLPSQEGVGVRIMNLHKAKGLEARVVILADCLGDNGKPRDEQLHIQRHQDSARGYLHVRRQVAQYVQQSVAHPENWPELASLEQQFAEAERQRLLYVAATRARELLVICYRTSRDGEANRNNPWRDLVKHLSEASRVEPDYERQPPAPKAPTVQRSELAQSSRSLESAWLASLPSQAQLMQKAGSNSTTIPLDPASMWQAML
ncbi:MAG: UvrD-helicase domain-containing protein [Gemmatales bacterium]